MDFKLLSNTYGWNYVKYFTLCRPLALNEVYLVEESSFYTDQYSIYYPTLDRLHTLHLCMLEKKSDKSGQSD